MAWADGHIFRRHISIQNVRAQHSIDTTSSSNGRHVGIINDRKLKRTNVRLTFEDTTSIPSLMKIRERVKTLSEG
jgi:hypothetical protein